MRLNSACKLPGSVAAAIRRLSLLLHILFCTGIIVRSLTVVMRRHLNTTVLPDEGVLRVVVFSPNYFEYRSVVLRVLESEYYGRLQLPVVPVVYCL
jgi:hypothetical protein